jgi:hypothetical protein
VKLRTVWKCSANTIVCLTGDRSVISQIEPDKALPQGQLSEPVGYGKSSQRGKRMPQAPVPPSHVREVLRSFDQHHRLVNLVKTLTQEIERLHEDNRQLQADIKFYREAARHCKGRAMGR